MKTFLIIVLFTLLYGGCAQKNAFERFHLNKTRELSEDTILSAKIKNGNKIDGIITVIYLNKVLPNTYKGNEYFYIYYYLKDKNTTLHFSLNDKQSMLREPLKAQNDFSYLTSFEAKWSKYDLVGFVKEGNVLNLKVTTSKGASATLQFVKDKI